MGAYGRGQRCVPDSYFNMDIHRDYGFGTFQNDAPTGTSTMDGCCTPCEAGTKQSSNGTTCETCDDGYYLRESSVCEQCSWIEN